MCRTGIYRNFLNYESANSVLSYVYSTTAVFSCCFLHPFLLKKNRAFDFPTLLIYAILPPLQV